MADILETQISRLTSQQALRSSQDRNAMLQRQQQLQQLQEAQAQEQRFQQLQEQQRQQQQSQIDSKSATKQEALRILIQKGKGSSALYSLSPQDRAEVEAIASELKASRERSAGIVAVSKAEQALSSSLAPELRRDIYLQGASGATTITLPDLNKPQQYFSPVKQQQYFTPAPKIETPRVSPIAFVKSGIYEVFKGEKLQPARDILSGRAYAVVQAKASAKPTIDLERNVYGVPTPGTPSFESSVKQYLKGQEAENLVLGSIVGVPKLPKVAKLPIRQPESLFFEVQIPIVTSSGEQKTLSSYQVISERVPPKIVIDSTKSGGALGSSDDLIINKPKFEISSTILPATERSPVITATTKTGKTAKLESLKGTAINIEPTELRNLLPTERYLFSKLTKSGQIRKLDKTSKFDLGYLETNNLGLEPTKRRFATASTTRQIAKDEKANLFESNIIFKELKSKIAGQEPRPSGATSSMRGFILRANKPVNIKPQFGETNIVSTGTTRTPLSKTFALQKVTQTPKPSPIVKARKTSLIRSNKLTISDGKLSLLGRSSVGVSSIVADQSSNIANDFNRGFSKAIFAGEKAQTTTAKPIALEKVIPLSMQLPSSKSETKTISIQLPKPIVRTITSQSPAESPKQNQGQLSLQSLSQATLQTMAIKYFPRGLPRPPNRPLKPKPIPRIPRFKLPSSGIGTVKVGAEDLFDVGIEVRRGGRFTLISKESSLGKALMKASAFVDVNLARSFRLRSLSTGELLDVASLPVGFRRAKREAKTFVESSSRALSQFGEKSEIKYFKKAKSKKRFSFI